MKKIVKAIMEYVYYYIACLLCVTACWVGLEYICEGVVHSSDIDGIVAIVLSFFITDKIIGGKNYDA